MLYFLFNSSTSFLGIIFSSRLRPTRTKVRKVKVRVLLVARVSPCPCVRVSVLTTNYHCADITLLHAVYSQADSRMLPSPAHLSSNTNTRTCTGDSAQESLLLMARF